MSVKRAHVGVVVAILAAAGAGFVVARATKPSASAPADAHADEDKAEHVKGFVALKPADAPAAGVEFAQVERGGGIDFLLPDRVAVAVHAQSVVSPPRRCSRFFAAMLLCAAGRRTDQQRSSWFALSCALEHVVRAISLGGTERFHVSHFPCEGRKRIRVMMKLVTA